MRRNILIAFLLCAAIAGAAGTVVYFSKREDPRYVRAVEHIHAANFADAAASLRLVLREKPDHVESKGLLAYCMLRQETDDTLDKDTAPKAILERFYTYYTASLLRGNLPAIKEKDSKETLEKYFNTQEKLLRAAMDEHRVPIASWRELEVSMGAVAPTLFRSLEGSTNKKDIVFRDICGALLASRGDEPALKYLIRRFSVSPESLGLCLVAGSPLKGLLSKETASSDSFLRKDGDEALRLLSFVEELRSFTGDYPKLRILKKGDLPKDQQQVLSETNKLWDPNIGEEAFVSKLIATQGQCDPLGLMTAHKKLDDERTVSVISAYVPEKHEFATRLLLWKEGQYHRLTVQDQKTASSGDWQTKLPLSSAIVSAEKGKKLALKVLKVEQVTKVETRSQRKNFTNYYSRTVWNPRHEWYPGRYIGDTYISGFWVGGYEEESVPYEDTYVDQEEFLKKRPALGNLIHRFELEDTAPTLKLLKKEWRGLNGETLKVPKLRPKEEEFC